MPTVTMPQLGESVAEGTIGKWLKQVGESVAVGEPLVEVITDKVNAEVPSPFEGVLAKVLVEEGQTVPNDAEIAVIEATGTPVSPEPPAAEPAATSQAAASSALSAPTPAPVEPPAPTGSPVPVRSTTPAPEPTAPAPTPVAMPVGVALSAPAVAPVGEYQGRMTPAVRRLAREHGVDLSQVPGTGFAGRVTRDDVLQHVVASGNGAATSTVPTATLPTATVPAATLPAAPPAATLPAAPPAATVPAAPTATAPAPPSATPAATPPSADYLKPMTQMRKGIAAQMTRASTVPTAYETVEVDMSSIVSVRDRLKREYTDREGISLSFVAFVTKAAVEALKRNPDLNSHWTDEGHWIRSAINIGVAVAVDDGLMVPVVRDADTLSIHGLNKAINEVAARTRTRKLKVSDIGGGTFTVDNTGWTGSILTLPILNVPEVAILTMEAIVKKPVVIEAPKGDSIAIRPMMAMVLGFDHRATDGAQAGRLLTDVKRWLEAVDDQTPIW